MPGAGQVRAKASAAGRRAAKATTTSIRIEGLDELMAKIDALGGAQVVSHGVIATNLASPPYPYFLEYGTSRMPAYPAARPAFDEMQGEAVREIGRIGGELVEQALRHGGGWDQAEADAAVYAGALPIQSRWQELARYRTGDYRRSILVTVGGLAK